MKRIFLFLLLILPFLSCSHKKEIPELLEGKFTSHFITFDYTQPKLNLEDGHLKELLVLLHHRVPDKEIKKYLKMNDSVWNDKINFLFGRGLIKKNNDGYFLPTFFLLDSDNANSLKSFVDSLGIEMSGIAKDRLGKIKEECAKIPALKNIPFEYLSLFILGSVVHDYWQEKFYQDQFIKSFMPHRGNGYYYFAMIQTDESESSAINLYETNFYEYPGFKFGSYAHTGEHFNIATCPTSALKNSFGKPDTENDSLFQKELITDLIDLEKKGTAKISDKKIDGFEKFGMMLNKKPVIPILTKSDEEKLYNIAEIITKDLVNYFENRQTVFVKRYLNSQYREETNYKEWMTWLYKMISSRAVDELINKKIIRLINNNPNTVFVIQK